ncbi:hypothetical protein PIB30_034985 [Stylosanthes scabra]|uniref:Uncharacterized protein n=1 Tax=Stylosanthes scabra TaxID=79078 RepID=A0ABU6QCN8_9FABA|nr:hypothetical protein [Stylosanthes scabra]
MAQQLSALNKKLEKLEVSAVGTQLAPQEACCLCGGPHENHNCSLILDDPSSTNLVGSGMGPIQSNSVRPLEADWFD